MTDSSEEFMDQLLNGIVEKKVLPKKIDEYEYVDGPDFLKFIADYIEESDIKFCTCGKCPDANRNNVIDGLRQTAFEIVMLKDSYAELSQMYEELQNEGNHGE